MHPWLYKWYLRLPPRSPLDYVILNSAFIAQVRFQSTVIEAEKAVPPLLEGDAAIMNAVQRIGYVC